MSIFQLESGSPIDTIAVKPVRGKRGLSRPWRERGEREREARRKRARPGRGRIHRSPFPQCPVGQNEPRLPPPPSFISPVHPDPPPWSWSTLRLSFVLSFFISRAARATIRADRSPRYHHPADELPPSLLISVSRGQRRCVQMSVLAIG